MSEQLKTKYEVIKILRDTLIEGMSMLGMSGWGVMEYGQASFEKADKIILLNNIRNERVGWQAVRYPVAGPQDILHRRDEWIEEQTWQAHVVLKRTTAPVSASTETAEDVADKLVAWLNGAGMGLLRNSGVAPLRIDTNTIFVYNDDSAVYQRRATFSVKVQVPKELTYRQDDMDTVIPKVMPV